MNVCIYIYIYIDPKISYITTYEMLISGDAMKSEEE
uniref:Uncharacterized protein n=1 Tax=Heterorhabditis bacteriophora TaxID=37862 RepID=A0A1I7X860_HETBA